MDKKYKLYQSEKGPRVFFLPEKRVGTIYIEMIVNCGSYMEEVVEISHFLEHMQGNFTSVKYPSAKKIRREFEDWGCYMNASTTDGQTNYHITCMREFFPRVLDIFLESFIHFKMDLSEFSAEKAAVITEIKQNHIADIWKTYFTTIRQQLYGPQIPFAYATPEERIKSVKKIKPQDLLTYRKKYYENPERYTLIVAGDFSPSVILREVQDKFVKPFLHQNEKQIQQPIPIPQFPLVFQDGTVMNVKNKNHLSNYKICMIWGIGNQVTPSDLKQRAATYLLTSVLQLRLFEILRSREGMIYGVNVNFYPDYYGSGVFSIQTETAKKNRKRLFHLVHKEMKKLSTIKIPSHEFEGIKNETKMFFYKDRQDISPENSAHFYSEQVSMSKPIITYTRLYNTYQKITPEDVLQMCAMILKCPRLIVYSG
jgi:predicted Zn-dependent peptidase